MFVGIRRIGSDIGCSRSQQIVVEQRLVFFAGFPYSSHHSDPVSPLQQKANANDFKTERSEIAIFWLDLAK